MEEKKLSLKEKMFKWQKELGPIKKTGVNPHFGNKHLEINDLLAVLKPIFNRDKVLLKQSTKVIDGNNILVTTLTDMESEDIEKCEMKVIDVIDPQKVGSCLTYYRRYSLVDLLGLETTDDDGTTGAGIEKKSNVEQPKDLGKCKDCGKPNLWSTKHERAYCSALCWKTKK